MTKHLNFIVLNDAYSQRIALDDIEPIELGQAYENLLHPVSNGLAATIKRGTGYTASGQISGKRAVFSVFHEGAQIAMIAVCLHSRAATAVWREIYQGDALPDLLPPSAPCVIVRYDVPESTIPDWLDRLAWHAAWYLMGAQQDMIEQHPAPEPEEIIAARRSVGLSQTAAAQLVHSGLRTWQQWEAGDRKMHPGLWELFCLKI